jgi:fructose/tagatose bisphosphate aldolase
VVDAAEQTHSPTIIGFNGEFLTGRERLAAERLEAYGALGRQVAESATVPCGLIFNECSSEARVRQAVTAGFNLVMLADPEAAPADYARRVADLVRFAHGHGAAVEAELGELPCGASGAVVSGHDAMTDPAEAARFVAATGVDVLSVSVGNVHIMVSGGQALDLERLAQIRRATDVPLGLHGGTGIPADSLRAAIRLGVTKVAYGTYLKQRYLAAVRTALQSPEINPHKLLGMGGVEDVMVAGRLAVRDAVLERIGQLGCCGRA